MVLENLYYLAIIFATFVGGLWAFASIIFRYGEMTKEISTIHGLQNSITQGLGNRIERLERKIIPEAFNGQ